MAKKTKVIKAEDIQVIETDAFDRMSFDNIKEAPRLQEVVASVPNKKDKETLIEATVRDVFTSLYKMNPKIKEGAEGVLPQLMAEFLNMPEYKEYHAISQLDETLAAIGTINLSDKIIEQAVSLQEKLDEKQKEEIDQDGNPVPPPTLKDLDASDMAKLRQTFRAGLKEAQKQAEDMEETFRNWGVESGELQKMNAQERMELAARLQRSGKLMDVSNLVGRFSRVVATAAAMSASHGADEIVDIETSGDLSRVLPTELMKLHQSPILFYKDMVEGNLMSYVLQGEEPLARGPLVVCFDISGSMSGSYEMWAKAVTLSLLHYAEKQNRPFCYIPFSDRTFEGDSFNSNKPSTIKDKIKIAEINTTGGTNFQKPLAAGLHSIATEKDFMNGDLVFITDGDADVPEPFLKEFLKIKSEVKARVFGIGIGRDYNDRTLNKFCDYICGVDDTGDVSAVKEVAAFVHKKKVV